MANVEIGKAYVALMPSMDKFNSAIRKALKDLGVSKADLKAAGESAGEEIGKGASDGVKDKLKKAGEDAAKQFAESLGDGGAKAGEEAAKQFAKSFSSGSKKYMSQVTDIQKFINQTKERISFSNLVDSTASKKYQDTAHSYVSRIKESIAAENKDLTISALKQIAVVLGSAVSNIADKLGSKFLSAGKVAGRYFVNGASAVINGFKTIGLQAGQRIVDGIKSSYSMVYASMRNIGAQSGKYVISGIRSGFNTVSSVMRSVGTRAVSALKTAFSTVGSTMLGVGRQVGTSIMNGIRSSFSSVGSLVKNIASSQIIAAGKALGINLGQGIQSGLSTMKVAIGSVVGNIISGIASTVSSQMSTAITRLDTLKNFPRIMSGMGVAEDDAAASVQALSDSIDGLPTALNDLVSFTQKIVPSFDNNIESATAAAIAFNNALVAGGKDAGLQANALEQWSQMLAVGKVDMQAWRSVVNAMPAQMQQLAKAMGKTSTTELYESLVGSKNGKTPLTELTNKFIELNDQGYEGFMSFAEQAKTATNGIGTAITNVQNRIAKALATILDWIGQDTIANAINDVTKQFGPLAQAATNFMDSIDIKGYFLDVMDVLRSFAHQMSGVLAPITGNLRNVFNTVLMAGLTTLAYSLSSVVHQSQPLISTISSLIQQLPQLVARLVPVMNAFIGFKFGVWTATLQTWMRLSSSILPIVPQIFRETLAVYQVVMDTIATLASRLAPTVLYIYSTVSAMVKFLVPFITRIISALAPVVAALVEDMATMAMWAIALVTPIVERLAPVLKTMFGNVSSGVVEVIKAISGYIVPIASTLANIVSLVTSIVVQVVSKLAPTVNRIFEKTAGLISRNLPYAVSIISSLSGIFVTIYDQIISIIDTVLPVIADIGTSALESVVASVIGAVSELAPMIISIGSALASNVWPIVQQLFDMSVGLIKTVLPSVANLIQQFAPVFVTIYQQIINIIDAVLPVLSSIDAGTISSVFERAGGFAVSLVNTLSPFIPQALAFADRFVDVMGSFVLMLAGTTTPIILNLLDKGLSFIQTITPLVERIINALGPVVKLIASQILGGITKVAGVMADVSEGSGDSLYHIFETIGDAANQIFDILTPYIPLIIDTISQVVDALAPAIVQIISTLSPYIPKLSQLFADAATKLAPAIADSIDTLDQNGVFDSLIGFIDKAIKFASDEDNGLPKLAQTVSDIFNAFGSFDDTDGEETPIERIYNAIQPHIGDIMDMCSSIANDMAPALADIAEDIDPLIDPAIDLITKGGEFIADHLEGFLIFVGGVKAIKTVGSVALGLFGSNGLIPAISTVVSKLTAEGGLLSLITGGMAKAGSAIGTAASGAMAFLTSPAGIVAGLLLAVAAATWFFTCTDTGKELWGNFTDWLSGKVTDIKDWFKGLGDSLKKAFRGALDWVKGKWDDVVGSMNNSENWATPVPSARPFATGGIVTRPTNALIGEAGYPEAVVPLTAAGIEQFTSGLDQNYVPGQQVPNVTVQIDSFINQDTSMDVRTLSTEIGRQTLNQLKQQGVY